MMKRLYFTILSCVIVLSLWAEVVHIANPKTWTKDALAPYLDKTVSFDVPMYTVGDYNQYISPSCVATSGGDNVVYITGTSNISRSRVYSTNLTAKVAKSELGYYLQRTGGSFDGNTRKDILKGPDSLQIDAKGKHTLLVCAANLEYYLVKNLGTGYGPDSKEEHEKQRAKTRQAMALINADIYGLCEVEQGTAALLELCADMNSAHKDRQYTYVNNETSSSSGSYTMSAFIYDALKVRSIGSCKAINTEVLHRKYMQCFEELATKETFIFSMNHFKAMSGGGDTETRRVAEANGLNTAYNTYKVFCDEEDLLIMGDLNCYYGSKPISILLETDSRTDLHQYFHPEGSYSYDYYSWETKTHTIGYLDHAIVNPTLLPQVTGMLAYHINSDEDDCTYDKSCNDGTMFRYSDHDPILVGLKLDGGISTELRIQNYGPNLIIQNGEGGFVRIFDMSGNLLYSKAIDRAGYGIIPEEDIPAMGHGCYVVHVYHNGKNHVTKYIRP